MMSNINNNTTASNKPANPLAKEAELKAFENSFFPAGGFAKLANIPQAPPAPKSLNNVRTRPMTLKTRNWGNRSDNGYSGLNRSLYDRPNVFYWDSRPSSNNSRNLTDLTPSSTSSSSNIPQAPPLPQWNKQRSDNHLIKGKRLRLREWGTPGRKGWSGMNKRMYNRKNGMNIELNVIINELWATQQPKNKGTTERGLDLQQLAPLPLPQEQYIVQPLPLVQEVVQPVRSSVISAVTTTRVVPLAPQQLNRGFSSRAGIPLSTNNTAGFPLGVAPLLSTASILTTPSSVGSRIPTKKELRTQQKLLKKQNKRDAKLMKKGKLPPTSVLAAPPTILRPLVAPTIVEPIIAAPLSNNTGIVDRGYTSYGGVATTTGIIGPVSTTVLPSNNNFIANNFNNAPFIKQEPAFINVPAMSLVGSPMM